MYIFFFFFQAEDGIRDTSVTGVQTCALPILTATESSWIFFTISRGVAAGARKPYQAVMSKPGRVSATAGTSRSEERRVGKECRSRGAREAETESACSKSRTRSRTDKQQMANA